MLKKRLFLAILVFAVIITACNKKDENTDPFTAPYNGATVEQNKTALEDNGVQFVDQLSQLKDAQAIDVLINLSAISGNGVISNNSVSKKALAPIKGLSTIQESKGLKKLLRASMATDPENLSSAWDSIVGKYTYDTTTQEFVKTPLDNKVIILFPGLAEDKTNTASITIDSFAYTTLVDPVFINYDSTLTQLPTRLRVRLAYSGTGIASWDYAASFQTDGIPLSCSSALKVDEFSLSASLSHDPYSKGAITFSFKHSDQIILETHAEAQGNWTQTNIDSNTVPQSDTSYNLEWNYLTQEYDSVMYIDEYTRFYFENVIKNANAYIQLMNVKVAGEIDFNKFIPIVRNLEDSSDYYTEHQFVASIVKALNMNSKLVVVAADNSTMIAIAEAYAYPDEYNDWRVGMRFVFEDGSKVDAGTYFGEGFDAFFEALNNLIADINDEHDINIDYIHY
jgi:hypothetical protein